MRYVDECWNCRKELPDNPTWWSETEEKEGWEYYRFYAPKVEELENDYCVLTCKDCGPEEALEAAIERDKNKPE